MVSVYIKTKHLFPNGSQVVYNNSIELSVDCQVCKRLNRTISVDFFDGICIKNKHPFNAKILDTLVVKEKNKSVSGLFNFLNAKAVRELFTCTYLVQYEYTDFIDSKYKDIKSSSLPTWARIGFKITCTKCGTINTCSTQTNIVRPFSEICKCGQTLYTETDTLPLIYLKDKS